MRILKHTVPDGPCSVISGTPTSWIVRATPGKPPIFSHDGCVMKMCSNLDNFILCSCAKRWVPSPQLNRYLVQIEHIPSTDLQFASQRYCRRFGCYSNVAEKYNHLPRLISEYIKGARSPFRATTKYL